ncbi:hypothetical protein BH10PSE18_BH10PSE18_18730 [soil metagenome]
MTNERIQQWLSALVRTESASALEREAGEIISWLCSSGGAIALADEAAWDVVYAVCDCEEKDGHDWWRVEVTNPGLLLSDIDRLGAEELARAVRYLSMRRFFVAHPSDARLVRCPE